MQTGAKCISMLLPYACGYSSLCTPTITFQNHLLFSIFCYTYSKKNPIHFEYRENQVIMVGLLLLTRLTYCIPLPSLLVPLYSSRSMFVVVWITSTKMNSSIHNGALSESGDDMECGEKKRETLSLGHELWTFQNCLGFCLLRIYFTYHIV